MEFSRKYGSGEDGKPAEGPRSTVKTRIETRGFPHQVGPRLERLSCLAYPLQKPTLVKEVVKAVHPGETETRATPLELCEEFLLVTLTSICRTDRRSLTWKPLPSCTSGEEGQTLIAFAVSNPNPANDLTIPQTWADEWAWGQATCIPCLAYVWPVVPSQPLRRVCRTRALPGPRL